MYKKLVIVSDTAMYFHNGAWFGFSPVVAEIEYIAPKFQEIIWIGYNRMDLLSNQTMQAIQSKHIKCVTFEKIGGKGFFAILKIVVHYPVMFWIIGKHLWKASVIHTRAPSHPAFIAMLFSIVFPKKVWWHKFAGSWDNATLPFFYKFQKQFLILLQHTNVTLNGTWPGQPQHCLSFENPCLTEQHLQNGLTITAAKNFTAPFTLVFVGRLEKAKGMDVLLQALQNCPEQLLHKVHFIGDGPQRFRYEKATAYLKNKVQFHGFLNSEQVHRLLATSHFLVLPSLSEGFPKVIAEAACYGVIPVVSNVGAIPHYVNATNGFVWNLQASIPFETVLLTALQASETSLKAQSKAIQTVAESFTFEHYLQKVTAKIVK